MSLLSSLTNRIFLATAALAVLAIAVAVYRINVAVTAQAENELARGLQEAGLLLDEHRTTQFDHFSSEARLVADLSNFKAALTTRHPPTVQPIAEGFQSQIGSDLFIVTDPAGHLLAQSGRVRMPDDDAAVRETIAAAAGGREAVALWPHEGGVLQAVAVPSFIGPELVGTVTVGFSLDEHALARFKALTNSEIAFAIGNQLKASTLPPAFNDRLAPLIGRQGVQRVDLDGNDFVALSQPLALNLTGAAPPASGPPPLTALIMRSRTERLRFLSAVHRELAVTAVLAVLAATLLSYAVARTVTRPLGTIMATMREMAATGDLTRRIPASSDRRWEDEDARLLATTFNAMTDSIVRFQRDASQRERLSSLGRLSTVVAHEIRNPLMIIKTAVRGLKRPSVTPEQARTAAADIEEEVARLDRIVTEVLDFARPIKFDLSPADINALCEDAVRATDVEPTAAPVSVSLDPAVTSVVTDAERLRLALVNILTNARHAVASRWSGTAPLEGAIRLRTSRVNHRVVIEVRDRGTGIAPEDLPRVFDPYFTTRRTGSGLGLAISRSIVEGLGGTITVTSRVGEGTTVRIELVS
ncbi:MAG TPA: ATP-binding protein [Vicinamibacterales bacterium]|nr:ATP-binding protein [Vicinamibacterales bacterium]